MKKTSTILIASLITLGLTAQVIVSVPQVTKGLYNKKTASWCGPCGDWGATVNTNIENGIGSNGVIIKLSASGSGNLYHVACQDMYNAFDNQGHGSWPNFFVNAYNETEFSSTGGIYTATTTNNCINAINNFYSATAASINAGFDVTKINDSIVVNVTTEFFNTMNGNYYTGVYLLENNVMHQQNTGAGYVANNANHILRASMAGPSTFGVQVGAGSVAAGTLLNARYAVYIDPSWKIADLDVVTVIWENIGAGAYGVINANDIASSSVIGINEETASLNGIKIYPNPSNGIINILSTSAVNQNIIVSNILGEKMMNTVSDDNSELIKIDISSLKCGIYFIEAIDEENNKTVERIVKY